MLSFCPDTLFSSFVDSLQLLHPDVLSCLLWGVGLVGMLTFFRYFGAPGLYVYNVLAIVVANIQVLQQGETIFSTHPIALGTIIFSTTFLASDILTEHYGTTVAYRGALLSLGGSILMSVLMIVTLGFKPPVGDAFSVQAHGAMKTLFLPAPRLMLASLVSYFLSQLADIWIFQAISQLTQRRFLWLRGNLSTLLSAFLDNCIFSILAWVILSPHPVSMETLFFTYVLAAYVPRFIVSLLSTPVLYVSYFVKGIR